MRPIAAPLTRLTRADHLKAGDRIRRHGLTWTVHETLTVHDPDGITGIIATADGRTQREILVVTNRAAAVNVVIA